MRGRAVAVRPRAADILPLILIAGGHCGPPRAVAVGPGAAHSLEGGADGLAAGRCQHARAGGHRRVTGSSDCCCLACLLCCAADRWRGAAGGRWSMQPARASGHRGAAAVCRHCCPAALAAACCMSASHSIISCLAGFMSNRGRQIVASFLAPDLGPNLHNCTIDRYTVACQ